MHILTYDLPVMEADVSCLMLLLKLALQIMLVHACDVIC